MRRQFVISLIAALVCLFTYASGNETLKTKQFLYHEDFEGTADPVKLVYSRGKYVINYQGITDEKSFSGKKSYKFDITFAEPGLVDFEIPLDNIPVGENLKFTGQILVEEALPRSRAILALDLAYWPVKMDGFSGARSFPWNLKDDDWQSIAANLPGHSHSLASKTTGFSELFWAVKPENTGAYVQKVRIQLFARDTGDLNRRVVAYLDDLRIEGEVADKEDFQKDAEQRFAPVRERTLKKIAEWEGILTEAEKQLASLSALSPQAAQIKTDLEKKIKENDVRIMSAIQEARKNGWMTANTYQKLEPFYRNLSSRYIANISNLCHPDIVQRINARKYLVYAVDTTFAPTDWILPDTVLLPGLITDEIKITACPGEYEPASFVVRSFADIKKLQLQAGKLTGNAGQIPSSAVDIKVIKCWYQNAGLWSEGSRILTPELLLNDENIVQVDHEKKISRVKFNLPEGQKYLAFGDPEWSNSPDRKTQTPFWIANDSDTLLPVAIPADTNKQFWVTVKVPDDAPAGDYKGKIFLEADGFPVGEMTVSLTVLPIELSAPYCETSVFIHSGINTLEKRYRNEVKNQVAHGITALNSQFDGGPPGTDYAEKLERTLKIWKELGVPPSMLVLVDAPIAYGILAGGRSHKGITETIEISDGQKKLFLEQFTKYLNIMTSYGMRDIALHMADERSGKQLEAWLPVFKVVREAGGKVITCSQIGGKTFDIVGGKNDIFFCENGISKKEVEMWHSKGTKVWPVWNPSGGVEDTDLNRRNHGLVIWKTGCDGVTEYLYSNESGWIEAASEKGGGGDGVHNLVYKTTDGIIDTIQWEGYREGIDDIRYVTTLEKLIAQAKKSGQKKEAAAAAEKYLENIDVEYGDLNTVRSEIIGHILKLM